MAIVLNRSALKPKTEEVTETRPPVKSGMFTKKSANFEPPKSEKEVEEERLERKRNDAPKYVRPTYDGDIDKDDDLPVKRSVKLIGTKKTKGKISLSSAVIFKTRAEIPTVEYEKKDFSSLRRTNPAGDIRNITKELVIKKYRGEWILPIGFEIEILDKSNSEYMVNIRTGLQLRLPIKVIDKHTENDS